MARPNGRPAGTPDKLDDAIAAEICKLLELAVPAKYAAEANGISERCFYDWMEKGELALNPDTDPKTAEGLKPYAAFYAAVSRARAKAVPNLHAKALTGGKGSSAAMWFLERRYRDEYGPPEREKGLGSEVKIVIEGGLPKSQP